MSAQRPLELILARNLLSSLSTPAFLVGHNGGLLFYNQAAGAMLGRGFEESGTMRMQEWIDEFGPFGPDEQPLRYEDIPAAIALSENRPHHGNFRIRTANGEHVDIAASAIPIIGLGGASDGAIVFFWPLVAEEGVGV